MQTKIPPLPPLPPFPSVQRRKHFLLKRRNKRFSPLMLIGIAVTLVTILGAGTYFVILPRLWSHAAPPLLPGQQVWKNGTSSLLFGSNDPTFNPAQSQSLRLSLRQAGITLIRTPLANNGGTEIEKRLAQIQDIGAACLGILSTRDMTLDQQIVRTAGGRCQLYEFGNEPDNPTQSFPRFVKSHHRQNFLGQPLPIQIQPISLHFCKRHRQTLPMVSPITCIPVPMSMRKRVSHNPSIVMRVPLKKYATQ